MSFTCSETSKIKKSSTDSSLSVRSIKGEASLRGVSLFGGKETKLTLRPSSSGSGILFQRMDLPSQPLVPAQVAYVKETPRCTILEKEGVIVRSVEHILAAMKAFSIQDALIEIDGEEPPSGDGSASHFVELIQSAGVEEASNQPSTLQLERPLFLSRGDSHIVALPADYFGVSYTLSYPSSKLMRAQYYSCRVEADHFSTQVACSRTFSLYEEVIKMKEIGLLANVTLDNGVVIKDDEVLNPGGLHFPDEMARHKLLDVIGDLALTGFPFNAWILAVRSGHELNTGMAKLLSQHFSGGRAGE